MVNTEGAFLCLCILAQCILQTPGFQHLEPSDTDVKIDIHQTVSRSGRPKRSVDDFPEEINIDFQFQGSRVDLKLRRNFNLIDKNLRIFLNEDGRIVEHHIPEAVRLKVGEAAYYYEVINGSFFRVKNDMRDEHTGEFTFFGDTWVRNQQYQIQSPDESHPSHTISLVLEKAGSTTDYIQMFRPDKFDESPSDKLFDESLSDYPDRSERRQKRSSHEPNEIEILFAADYAVFNDFDDTVSQSEANRPDVVRMKIGQHYSSMMAGMSVRYATLTDPEIELLVAGLFIAETPEDAPFVENYKLEGNTNGRDRVNASAALDAFGLWASNTSAGLPNHDHAMVFSGYDIGSVDENGFNGNTIGLAFLGYICSRSDGLHSSINEDHGNLGQDAATAAHELGHNLNASHNGDGNNCSADSGFIMDAGALTSFDNFTLNRRGWLFSSCTVAAFEAFINDLDSNNMNCMSSREATDHSEFDQFANMSAGQLELPDGQCKSIVGPNSYFFRNIPMDESDICAMMPCITEDNQNTYFPSIAWEGTTCGVGKACVGGNCETSPIAPTNVTEGCLFGDSPNILPNDTETCTEKIMGDNVVNLCNVAAYGLLCCETCANILATTVTTTTESSTASDVTTSTTDSPTTSTDTATPSTESSVSTESTTTDGSTASTDTPTTSTDTATQSTESSVSLQSTTTGGSTASTDTPTTITDTATQSTESSVSTESTTIGGSTASTDTPTTSTDTATQSTESSVSSQSTTTTEEPPTTTKESIKRARASVDLTIPANSSIDLEDKTSPEYAELKQNLTMQIESKLESGLAGTGAIYEINLTEISPGSVVVKHEVVFQCTQGAAAAFITVYRNLINGDETLIISDQIVNATSAEVNNVTLNADTVSSEESLCQLFVDLCGDCGDGLTCKTINRQPGCRSISEVTLRFGVNEDFDLTNHNSLQFVELSTNISMELKTKYDNRLGNSSVGISIENMRNGSFNVDFTLAYMKTRYAATAIIDVTTGLVQGEHTLELFGMTVSAVSANMSNISFTSDTITDEILCELFAALSDGCGVGETCVVINEEPACILAPTDSTTSTAVTTTITDTATTTKGTASTSTDNTATTTMDTATTTTDTATTTTDTASTTTDTASTTIDTATTTTDTASTTTDTATTSTDTASTTTDTASTTIDTASTTTDTATTSTDTASTTTDTASTTIDTATTTTDTASTTTDTASTTTDTASTTIDTATTTTDTASTTTDTATTSTDTASTTTDTASTTTDTATTTTDTASTTTDTTTISTDTASTTTDTAITSTDTASITTSTATTTTDTATTTTDTATTTSDTATTTTDTATTTTDTATTTTDTATTTTGSATTTTDTATTTTDAATTTTNIATTTTDTATTNTDTATTTTDTSTTTTDTATTTTATVTTTSDTATTTSDTATTTMDTKTTTADTTTSTTETPTTTTLLTTSTSDTQRTSTDTSTTSMDQTTSSAETSVTTQSTTTSAVTTTTTTTPTTTMTPVPTIRTRVSIRIIIVVTIDLNNKSSSDYLNLVIIFKVQLELRYGVGKNSRIRSVNIINISPGSLNVDHEVEYEDTSEAAADVTEAVVDIVKGEEEFEIFNETVTASSGEIGNLTFTNETVSSDTTICELFISLKNETCESGQTCVVTNGQPECKASKNVKLTFNIMETFDLTDKSSQQYMDLSTNLTAELGMKYNQNLANSTVGITIQDITNDSVIVDYVVVYPVKLEVITEIITVTRGLSTGNETLEMFNMTVTASTAVISDITLSSGTDPSDEKLCALLLEFLGSGGCGEVRECVVTNGTPDCELIPEESTTTTAMTTSTTESTTNTIDTTTSTEPPETTQSASSAETTSTTATSTITADTATTSTESQSTTTGVTTSTVATSTTTKDATTTTIDATTTSTEPPETTQSTTSSIGTTTTSDTSTTSTETAQSTSSADSTSTTAASTTTTEPATSPTESTTRSFATKITSVRLVFPITVTFSLSDKTFSAYVALVIALKMQFESKYRAGHTDRFVNVNITDISNGSTIVDHEVEYEATPAVAAEIINVVRNMVKGDETITIENTNVSASTGEIDNILVSNETVSSEAIICQLFVSLFDCESGQTCVVTNGQPECKLTPPAKDDDDDIGLILGLAIGLPLMFVFIIICCVGIGRQFLYKHNKKSHELDTRHKHYRFQRSDPFSAGIAPYHGGVDWREQALNFNMGFYKKLDSSNLKVHSHSSNDYDNRHGSAFSSFRYGGSQDY